MYVCTCALLCLRAKYRSINKSAANCDLWNISSNKMCTSSFVKIIITRVRFIKIRRYCRKGLYFQSGYRAKILQLVLKFTKRSKLVRVLNIYCYTWIWIIKLALDWKFFTDWLTIISTIWNVEKLCTHSLSLFLSLCDIQTTMKIFG